MHNNVCVKISNCLAALAFNIFAAVKLRNNCQNKNSEAYDSFIRGAKNMKSLNCWHKDMFFEEGKAFRAAAISSLSGNSDKIQENYNRKDFKIMQTLGYGFWEGISERFKINKRIKPPSGINRDIFLNGKSFAIAITSSKDTFLKNMRELKIKRLRDVHKCIGYGRAAWWKLDPKDHLEAYHGAARAVLCGMVMAACFTQAGDKLKLNKYLKDFIEKYPNDLELINLSVAASIQVMQQQSNLVKKNIKNNYKNRYNSDLNLYYLLCNKLLSSGRY